MDALAANLRRLRKERNLTQAALADKAGLPRATLASLEQPETNPGIQSVMQVAAALEVSIEELLTPAASERAILVPPSQHRIYRADHDRFLATLVSPLSAKGVEMQAMRFLPGCNATGRPHPQGAQEFFYCQRGTATLIIDGEAHSVPAGHLIQFPGHLPHAYRNLGEESVEAVSVVAQVR